MAKDLKAYDEDLYMRGDGVAQRHVRLGRQDGVIKDLVTADVPEYNFAVDGKRVGVEVELLADMAALDTTNLNERMVSVVGKLTATDGLGGRWRYYSTGRSGVTVDGYNYVASTESGNADGYYHRVTRSAGEAAFATLAAIKASASLVDGHVYTVSGYTSANDGGGGQFTFDASATDTANEGTIVAVTSGGRLFRVLSDSRLMSSHFGLVGGSTTETQLDAWLASSGLHVVDSDIQTDFAKTVAVPLAFEGAGKWTHSGSDQIELDSVTANRNQIFYGSFLTTHSASQYDVTPRPTESHPLAFTSQNKIHPEWWGLTYGASADASDALDSMQKALIRSRKDGDGVHWDIEFAPNKHIRSENNKWSHGLWSVDINFNNCTVENLSESATSVLTGILTRVDGDTISQNGVSDNEATPALSYLIDDAAAGATSVTLQSATRASDFRVGSYIFLSCYATQVGGYPPNPEIFEYARVSGVSGAVISLEEPLRNSYDSSYPDLASDDTYTGAARAWPMPGLGKYRQIRNIQTITHPSPTTQRTRLRVYDYVANVVKNCNLENVYPGISDTVTFENCTAVSVEGDKCVRHIRYDDCNIDKIDSHTGVDFTEVIRSAIEEMDKWHCPRTKIESSRIKTVNAGTSVGVSFDISNSVISNMTADGHVGQFGEIPTSYFVDDETFQCTETQWSDIIAASSANLSIGTVFLFAEGTNIFDGWKGLGEIKSVTSDGTTVTMKYQMVGGRTGAATCRVIPYKDINIAGSTVGLSTQRVFARSINHPENGFAVQGGVQAYEFTQSSNSTSSSLGWRHSGGQLVKLVADVLKAWTPAAYTFTADAGTDVVTATGHVFDDDATVRLTTTGTLPAGLAVSTTYHVIESASNTLKLSATSGGSAIDITDSGSGTHTVTRYVASPGFTYNIKNSSTGAGFVDASTKGRRFVALKQDESGNDTVALGSDSLGMNTGTAWVFRYFASDGEDTTGNMPAHTDDEAALVRFQISVRSHALRL